MNPARLDRPAVAVILSAALAVGALLGVYAAHVTPQTAPPSTSLAGAGWSTTVQRFTPTAGPRGMCSASRHHAPVCRTFRWVA